MNSLHREFLAQSGLLITYWWKIAYPSLNLRKVHRSEAMKVVIILHMALWNVLFILHAYWLISLFFLCKWIVHHSLFKCHPVSRTQSQPQWPFWTLQCSVLCLFVCFFAFTDFVERKIHQQGSSGCFGWRCDVSFKSDSTAIFFIHASLRPQ